MHYFDTDETETIRAVSATAATTTAFKLDTDREHTGGNLFEVKNNATGGCFVAHNGDFVASGLKSLGPVTIASQTPATTGAAATAGTIAWDVNFFYVCVSGNSWKRSALSTW
jgi:hypothetical protein